MSEMNSRNICIFGPQGSGKGTQSEKLSDFFGIPQIAPGNIFRKAVADGTALGKKVEKIINDGKLVPNEITNELMRARIEEEDCLEGFVLDGYPRNESQADALDSMTSLSKVVVIDIPDEESIQRISSRRICTDCGITYHLESKPPVKEGVCDSCGKELIYRDDDKPEAILKRLQIYHTETEPLFERYKERNIVCRVNGAGSIDDVWNLVQGCFP